MAAKKVHCNCLDTVKPVRDALDVINGKWKLPIIISVSEGNERFTDIQESIPGISPKVLAKELKDLEQNKLIRRIVVDAYPVKILYKSETYAETLTPVIHALKDWGINHRKKIIKNQWLLKSIKLSLQEDYTSKVELIINGQKEIVIWRLILRKLKNINSLPLVRRIIIEFNRNYLNGRII